MERLADETPTAPTPGSSSPTTPTRSSSRSRPYVELGFTSSSTRPATTSGASSTSSAADVLPRLGQRLRETATGVAWPAIPASIFNWPSPKVSPSGAPGDEEADATVSERERRHSKVPFPAELGPPPGSPWFMLRSKGGRGSGRSENGWAISTGKRASSRSPRCSGVLVPDGSGRQLRPEIGLKPERHLAGIEQLRCQACDLLLDVVASGLGQVRGRTRAAHPDVQRSARGSARAVPSEEPSPPGTRAPRASVGARR